jgi:eukaryotic-like serine/threonine-protein kinase
VTFSIVTEKHEVWRLAIGGAKQEADQGPKNLRATTATQAAGQEEVRRAEPLLLAGYESMKQREKTIPPQGQVRLPEALDRLIESSTATNKRDDAKKWQAELAKYP